MAEITNLLGETLADKLRREMATSLPDCRAQAQVQREAIQTLKQRLAAAIVEVEAREAIAVTDGEQTAVHALAAEARRIHTQIRRLESTLLGLEKA